jgi:GT2 family glycosyltransferase
MSKFKKLSIVIVNFKSQRYLKNCIASLCLKVAPKIETEIIVVNNDIGENLEEVKDAFPQVKFISNSSNIGLSPAWNQGKKRSKGQIVWFLNPDTEIVSDNIKNLLDEFEEDENLGVIGTGLVDLKNKKQAWSAGKKISLWDTILNNLGIIRSRKIWESEKKTIVDWVSGASIFARRDFFEKVKGFDENIFLYFEDADFCQRMRVVGKKIIFYPEFRVRHLSGGSHPDKNEQKANFYKSQDYYFKKHLGFFQLAGLKILRKIFVGK